MKGRLLRLHAGVYAFAGTVRTFRRGVMAAHLAAGPLSAASASTAATLMRVLDRRSSIELLVPYRCNPTQDGFRVRRTRKPFATLIIENIPAVAPVRTLEDLVRRLPESQLEETFDSMWRKRYIRPSDFADSCAILRAFAAERARDQGPPGSVKETEVRRLLRASGFPPPVAQFRIVAAGYVPVFFTRATLADPEPTLCDLRGLLERRE